MEPIFVWQMKIYELELEGTHSSWDEQICIGYEVKAEAIGKLCHDIHMYMMSAVESVEEKKEYTYDYRRTSSKLEASEKNG